MASLGDIVFTPALGTSLAVPEDSPAGYLYAVSPRSVEILVKWEDGTTADLEPINTPSVGGLLTYRATLPTSRLPARVTVETADGTAIPGPNTLNLTVTTCGDKPAHKDFNTTITLTASEDNRSITLDWLDGAEWQGWAWQRMRPTWIDANFVPSLAELTPDKNTHCLLLRPSETEEGRKRNHSEVLAVFAASSRDAFVTLSGPRGDEQPGVYARVRRVGSPGSEVKVHVTGRLTTHLGETTAIRDAVQHARVQYGLAPAEFQPAPGVSPFDRLGFCTWSSIGENVLLTKENMGDLISRLKKDAVHVPLGSFIIDDGWQDIRHGLNGHPDARGLWGFDAYEGMGCSLKDLVTLIKTELPSVKEVGVWMTLAGYWNSIAPGSPLAEKYGAKRYNINRSNIPGQYWPEGGFDNQQSGTIADAEGQFWVLPPPERLGEFWKDYFGACRAAGVDFVKVDNQAYGGFLEGVGGGQEFVAMWDAMFTAANETFGLNRVIHCMAHYERTFSGDIGLGIPSNNQKIIVRNSDDFGLDRPNIHRDHIHLNLYNAMLLDQLACVPDPDMFMTSAQWPEYHAALRAFFALGPILLADKPGTWNVDVVRKLIGKNTSGEWEVVRAKQTARPLARNVWERTLDDGHGPSIKASSSFGNHGASIVLWSSRAQALHSSADVLFERDILDALGEKHANLSPCAGYVLWVANAGKAIHFTLQKPQGGQYQTPLVSVALPPEAVEVITVAPFHRVGGEEVATIGLVDKYASLTAVKDVHHVDGKLTVQVKFAGSLGFIVKGCESNTGIEVQVDGNAAKFSRESIGIEDTGLSLVKVDLSKVEPMAGKTTWTVEIVPSSV